MLLNISTEKIEADSCATAIYNLQLLSDTIWYFKNVSNFLFSVGSHLPGVYFSHSIHENVELSYLNE
jgi:hypothetical protein